MIDVNNLTYSYDKKLVLDKISFTIKKGSWASLTGANGSGKTTLMKLLLGILKGTGYINIDGIELTSENAFEVRENMGAILSKVENMFIYDRPIEELSTSLRGNSEDVCKLAKSFSITHILKKSTSSISDYDKHMLALSIALSKNPSVLIIDETFMNLSPKEEKEIINFIYDYTKENEITVINITHNPENLLLSDKVLVLKDTKLIFEGTKEVFFENEDVVNDSSLTLPFTKALSKKLRYYNLLEKDIESIEEMVGILWK